jgi:MFS transporter, CP family, cyanate transporter
LRIHSTETSRVESATNAASIAPALRPPPPPAHPAFKTAGSNGLAAGIAAPIGVVAIILVAISLRPGIVSVGPILPSLMQEFKLSHATASLLTAIPTVLMGLLALPTPWLARRLGRDLVLLLALSLLCVSMASRAYSANPAELLASTIGVGAGIAIAGTLIAGFIKARFPARAAVIMGIYATALSFGSTISAAATGPLASTSPDGWRLASGVWSISGVLAIFGWLAVVLSERRRCTAPPIATSRPRLPFKNGTAWLVALFFAFNNFLCFALLSWTSPMYRDAGLSATVAGLVLASYTAAFMVANPVFGWLSKSVDRRGWLAACGGVTLLGLVPTALSPNLAPFLFIPLSAFGMGGAFTLGMTLPLDNAHNVDEANVWNAFVLTIGYLVGAAGPILVGLLRDVDGNYHLALWLLVAIATAMLLLTPFLRPCHQKRTSSSACVPMGSRFPQNTLCDLAPTNPETPDQ